MIDRGVWVVRLVLGAIALLFGLGFAFPFFAAFVAVTSRACT